ncbi:MAG: M28-family zinc metallopeptidase, partial [Caulobacter sp.]|nr:M28-family zinc metallopeptidase [Caulobacter sp.]
MRAIRLFGFWICLVVGLALGAVSQRTPAPVAADAPQSAFSAQRALVDVRAIAQKPHPIGSTESAGVRDHLLARATALGLEVSVRPGEGLYPARNPRFVSAGAVQNLMAVAPGNDRDAPAVLVMSHYDSVPNSPGAADDAAGVAAALEVARALQAAGPHARDVIF